MSSILVEHRPRLSTVLILSKLYVHVELLCWHLCFLPLARLSKLAYLVEEEEDQEEEEVVEEENEVVAEDDEDAS